MKNIFYLLFVVAVSYKTTAQITYIPDSAFEQRLINLGIDSDGIINGQVFTSDIENVTELYIEGSSMSDITGIQDFLSLEELTITHTYITTLDVSNNLELRYLFCEHNLLTEIDVSNNILLEELYCGNNHDDVSPQNQITYIDLSNNPNIHTVFTENMFTLLDGYINLINGNNNENMYINVQRSGWDWDDDTPICIQVDNPENAINGNLPYSQWNVIGGHHFSGNDCSLNTQSFTQSNIKVYPNPVSAVLYFDLKSNNSVQKVTIFDFLGRKVTEKTNCTDAISVSHLQKGSYLIKIVTDKGVQTKKIIVK